LLKPYDVEPAAAESSEVAMSKKSSRSPRKPKVKKLFVVDGRGVLAREWRGVKVPGHVEEVLNFVKAL